jgi:hypothetical protein
MRLLVYTWQTWNISNKTQIKFFGKKKSISCRTESGVASLKVVYRVLFTCNVLFISVSQRTVATIFIVEFLVLQKLFPFTIGDVV